MLLSSQNPPVVIQGISFEFHLGLVLNFTLQQGHRLFWVVKNTPHNVHLFCPFRYFFAVLIERVSNFSQIPLQV